MLLVHWLTLQPFLFYIDNNILNREAGGRAAPVPSLSEVVPMSTYEELQMIVSVAMLIIAILNYTHKK
jgi:hypothetical protein